MKLTIVWITFALTNVPEFVRAFVLPGSLFANNRIQRRQALAPILESGQVEAPTRQYLALFSSNNDDDDDFSLLFETNDEEEAAKPTKSEEDKEKNPNSSAIIASNITESIAVDDKGVLENVTITKKEAKGKKSENSDKVKKKKSKKEKKTKKQSAEEILNEEIKRFRSTHSGATVENVSKQSNETTVKKEFVDYYKSYPDENALHIPNRMGFSTSAWGNTVKRFLPVDRVTKIQARQGLFSRRNIHAAYKTLMDNGILLADTSPGSLLLRPVQLFPGDKLLAECMELHEGKPILAASHEMWFWQNTVKGLATSLSKSCQNLGVSSIDLLQVRKLGALTFRGLGQSLAHALESGQTKYVGVVDMSPKQLSRVVKELSNWGVEVVTNSFDYSLTNRKKESWIEACKDLGVIPLIKDPLGGGVASGQVTPANPTGGLSGLPRYSLRILSVFRPFQNALRSVAETVSIRVPQNPDDDTESPSNPITGTQIALNYVIAKGGVPLPEINSMRQANEVIESLKWKLKRSEISELEVALPKEVPWF